MIREIVDQFLQALSTGNFELMKPHISESVVYVIFADRSLRSIDLSLEKQAILEGIDNLKKVFDMFVGAPNNAIFEAEAIACDYPSAILWGKMVGTTWKTPGAVHVEEQFDVRSAFLLTLKDDKIQKIEFRVDTFELMRLSGKTVTRSGDKTKIKAYVERIRSLGLIPQIPDD